MIYQEALEIVEREEAREWLLFRAFQTARLAGASGWSDRRRGAARQNAEYLAVHPEVQIARDVLAQGGR